jgi:lipopolysaccharide/colanic/teichoic acid biosynthesis glycosyltransferase
MKRVFDLALASLALLLLSPLLFLVAVMIKFDSRGPFFFRQERIGRGGRPFLIFKFRTMVQDAPSKGGAITFRNDPRITGVGKWLRRTKIDELPQLLNIMKGQMSFVGPRPEVRKYVDLFRQDFDEILQVRPGLTDLASLRYRDEAELLGSFENPEEAYRQQILPDKIRLAKEYLRQSSMLFDMALIFRTFLKILRFPVSSNL